MIMLLVPIRTTFSEHTEHAESACSVCSVLLTNSDWYEDNHLFSVMLVAIKHERPCGRESWVSTGFLKVING